MRGEIGCIGGAFRSGRDESRGRVRCSLSFSWTVHGCCLWCTHGEEVEEEPGAYQETGDEEMWWE